MFHEISEEAQAIYWGGKVIQIYIMAKAGGGGTWAWCGKSQGTPPSMYETLAFSTIVGRGRQYYIHPSHAPKVFLQVALISPD